MEFLEKVNVYLAMPEYIRRLTGSINSQYSLEGKGKINNNANKNLFQVEIILVSQPVWLSCRLIQPTYIRVSEYLIKSR